MTSMQLPEGYSVRAATLADIEAITELINAVEIDEAGEPEYLASELAEEWADLEIAERVALIESADGVPTGLLVLTSRGDIVHHAEIYIHPEHTGRGLGTYLVLLSEARAGSWIESAPKGKRIVIRNGVHVHNQSANTLLTGLGYVPARYFWRMEINLESEPDVPALPDGFEIRPCQTEHDERAIFETVNDAFQDHWSYGPTNFEEWSKRHSLEPSLTFQLFDGEKMAGVIVCRIYGGDLGWIGDLGVRMPWRRRGLGTTLLKHAFAEFYRHGIRRVGLGVDTQNEQGATDLYKNAGMRVTRHFAVYEKELRPGEP